MSLKLLVQYELAVAATRYDILTMSAYGTSTILVKSIWIGRVDVGTFKIDVSIAPNGEAHANKHCIMATAEVPLEGVQLDIPFALQNGDVVRAMASVDNAVISLFGELQS